MFERLRNLYRAGKIDAAGLQFWVNKGVITQAQMDIIIRENSEEENKEDKELTE